MFVRRTLPLAVTFLAGTFIVLQYYFVIPGATALASQMVQWNVILAAFALALGLGSVVRIHLHKVQRKAQDWQYSVILLAILAIWLAVGLTDSTGGQNYKWLWNNVLLPVSSTSYATTFFFVTSAAYRAFRVKNLQSALLLLAAIIVMGRVGIFAVVAPFFGTASQWIMDIPNTAGMRAVTIGASLALVANAFRIIVGLERSYLGGGE
jgi:hypothetical protein